LIRLAGLPVPEHRLAGLVRGSALRSTTVPLRLAGLQRLQRRPGKLTGLDTGTGARLTESASRPRLTRLAVARLARLASLTRLARLGCVARRTQLTGLARRT
jgi:hypothetical protein